MRPTETTRDDEIAARCPRCSASLINLMEQTSRSGESWWISCAACGHIWTVPKGRQLRNGAQM